MTGNQPDRETRPPVSKAALYGGKKLTPREARILSGQGKPADQPPPAESDDLG